MVGTEARVDRGRGTVGWRSWYCTRVQGHTEGGEGVQERRPKREVGTGR